MQKSTNTKSGFTLVELIIVITILAILAAIAFISFQGYTKDARNSKRVSDLNSLSRSIEVKMADAVSPINFVSTGTTKKSTSGTEGIGGVAASSLADTTYNATDAINFTILGGKSSDFQDPKGGNYLIGASTLAGGVYEVATTSYESDTGLISKVVGNYKPRTTSNTVTLSATTSTGSTTTVVNIDAGLGILKYGDTVTFGTQTGTISAVSNDLSRLTLTTSPALTTALTDNSTGALSKSEISSLIN